MKRLFVLGLALTFALAACDTTSLQEPPSSSQAPAPSLKQQDARPSLEKLLPDDLRDLASSDAPVANAQAFIARVNERLATGGLQLALQKAEWVTDAGSHEAGQTVFANDRTLRLGAQWVAGDERRGATGAVLTHVTWEPFLPANFGTPQQFDAAPIIDASLETWDGVTCSKLDVELMEPTFSNPSAILGGNPFLADISTVGFLPGFFFELFLGPGASESVLGVTFTFIWIDDNGTPDDPDDDFPTDVNDDGYADVALKEVWYNDAFLWTTDGSGGIDTESVALHENGHALGLDHFGKIFITGNKTQNTKLHVSPEAVMNAAYLGGELREPLGTDNGAYCGLYAQWPR